MGKGKIYVGIRSGLGNQLFQFAFAYALSRKYNKEIVLCPTFYYSPIKKIVKKILGMDIRSFQLKKINIPELRVMNESRLMSLLAKNNIKTISETDWQTEKFDQWLKETDGSVYLKGYWQDKELFENHRAEMHDFIKPLFKLSTYAASIETHVNNENVLGIHVRRGDFLTNKAFGACDSNYYNNGIALLVEKNRPDRIIVFSNDIDWAKTNLNVKDIPTIFYENKATIKHSDIEELYLMSLCHHLIISNSTFSWWPAWLKQKEGDVIAPKTWFTSASLEEESSRIKEKNWTYVKNTLNFN